ncbi:protein CURLY FLAG LEAF 1-like [Elaeis guineensis]|uniref:protein CURLY FLAG LEAF 1-like n=1 Tax=Elaeis guineensis var. tenera TaxID=51953 RepID=UPI00057AADD3
MEGKNIKLETANTVEMDNPKRSSNNSSCMPIKVESEMSPPDGYKKDMKASSLVAGTVAQPISEKLESSTPPKYRDQLLNEYIKLKSYVPLPNTFEQWLDVEAHKIYHANMKNGIKRTYEEHCNIYSLYKSHYFYKPTTNYLNDDRLYQKGDGSSHVQPFFPSPLVSSNSRKAAEPRNYLVAVGCGACYIYMMVTKGTKECPKCGGYLIHFDKGKSPEQYPVNSKS